MAKAPFGLGNTYAAELEGFYVPWQGATVPEPRIVYLDRALETLEGTTPLAQAYAGHQFGNFVPQL
jgi:hypothetical protein